MTEISPLSGGLLRIHKVITRGLKISIRKCDEYIEKKGIPPKEIDGLHMLDKIYKSLQELPSNGVGNLRDVLEEVKMVDHCPKRP